MTQRPFILITNDDGVYAPGIKHLWQALDPIADVAVVAPASEQSAVSLSITIRRPLHIEKIEWPLVEAKVWSINGTPADCVKLALNAILPKSPDLIVSGINRGSNAGRNVLYSGTAAAVVEGTLHNIPGIAFSTSDYSNPDYASIESHIPLIMQYVLDHPLPVGTFLNVNFPKNMKETFRGIRLTRQGKEFWGESLEQREHPAEQKPYYWLGARLVQFDEEENSDIKCLNEGYATAVPIHMGDLTHHDHVENFREHFETIVNKRSYSDVHH